jgi:predicted dithiol-disulfide oxidoreductase (DUF899 family)
MAKQHEVVPSDKWIEARKKLLAKEKEFTRLRDQLSRERRDLPWEAVDKEYLFDGPDGRQTLPELFDGRGQLVVYHFMFGPDWEAGCPHCSRWAGSFNGIIVHLNQRNVTMIAVSRAPYGKLAAYRKRMGFFHTYSTLRHGLWARGRGSDSPRSGCRRRARRVIAGRSG